MYCIKCGKENNNGQALCDDCIRKLNSPFAEDNSKAEVEEVSAVINAENAEIPAKEEPAPKNEAEKLAEEYDSIMGKQEPKVTYQPAQEVRPQYYGGESTGKQIMYGFGLGLAGLIIAYIALTFATMITELVVDFSDAFGFAILLLPMLALSAVFSIISLARSKSRVSQGYRKPIPTFIFGLLGTIFSGLGTLLILVMLMAL